MIDIQPTQTGFPLQQATKIKIEIITHDTTANQCKVYWRLFSQDNVKLHEGNVPIDEIDYENWNHTNTSLENIVLTKLNLQRKNATN